MQSNLFEYQIELPRHPVLAAIVFVPSVVAGFYGAGAFGMLSFYLDITDPYLIGWSTIASTLFATSLLAAMTLSEFVKNIPKRLVKLPTIRSVLCLGLCTGMVLFSVLLFLAVTFGEPYPPPKSAGSSVDNRIANIDISLSTQEWEIG